jgi:hypothetical protein
MPHMSHSLVPIMGRLIQIGKKKNNCVTASDIYTSQSEVIVGVSKQRCSEINNRFLRRNKKQVNGRRISLRTSNPWLAWRHRSFLHTYLCTYIPTYILAIIPKPLKLYQILDRMVELDQIVLYFKHS